MVPVVSMVILGLAGGAEWLAGICGFSSRT